MSHFFLRSPVSGDKVSITEPAQIHHIRNVLRLRNGAQITVSDSAGAQFGGVIRAITQSQVVIEITRRLPVVPGKLKVIVACSIPAHGKMDEIIDKLTQLDVAVIIPMMATRCVVRLEKDSAARLARWRKIALNAAEQSQRRVLPVIEPVLNLGEVLEKGQEYQLKMIPTLIGATKPLQSTVANVAPTSIIVLIGPEGDFTQEEVGQAMQAGFIPVSLGPTVLRVETAAVAVASFLKLSFRDVE